MRQALLAMAFLALGACAHAAECTRAGEDTIAEGRLIARGDALILTLPVPMCLSGDEDTDNVAETKEIHVYSPDEALQSSLRGLAGKDVQVRGTMMGAVTQHHKAPIVMQATEADEI
jgi:Domain of unknown function (DUF4431)